MPRTTIEIAIRVSFALNSTLNKVIVEDNDNEGNDEYTKIRHHELIVVLQTTPRG